MQQYIDGVLSGDILAGRLVRLAVLRHVVDLDRAGRRGFVFDPQPAIEAIEFIERCCRHSVGEFAGQPFLLSPWQKFVVWSLFGWRRKENNVRRFRKALIEIARKNGKSTFSAALALLLLVFDRPVEPGAEIYCVATKEKQAQIVHREAKRMVQRSPALRRRLRVLQKSITYPQLDSFFQPLGSDSDSTDGLNTHAVVMDELHAWQPRHRGLYEKLTTAGGARQQPLVIAITTAGDDRSIIYEEERDLAVRVLESVVTGEIVSDIHFAYIASIDYPGDQPCWECVKRRVLKKRRVRRCRACKGKELVPPDDPFDESVWPKANPNLGISVSLEYLREQANEAKQKPTALNSFLRYHCNVRVTSTEKAIRPELWAAAAGELTDPPDVPACGAWDLGRSDDWSAIALVWPFYDEDGEIDRYEIRTWSFTCEARAEELCNARVQQWIDAGLLEVHWGDQVDFGAIRDKILELNERYQVASWAYDPTFSQQLAQELLNEHGLNVFKFTQAAKFYNEPIRTFLRCLARKQIRHDGDPVLAWQAGNLTIRRNWRDEWMPDKVASDGKIDAMVALLMAFSECLFQEHQAERSVYEERGIRTL